MRGAVSALAYVTDLAEALGGASVPGKGPFLQLSVAPLKLKRAVKTHEQGRGGYSRSRGPGCPHLGPLVLQKAGVREEKERGLACSGSLGSCFKSRSPWVLRQGRVPR